MIGGWAGIGLADRPVICAQNELAIFDPPTGQDCRKYLSAYLENGAPGTLLNPLARSACEYCPLQNANQFLASSWIEPSESYRNLGIIFGFIIFNMVAAVAFYYMFRVRGFSIKSLRKPKAHAEGKHKAQEEKVHKKKGFYLGSYYHWVLAILRNLTR